MPSGEATCALEMRGRPTAGPRLSANAAATCLVVGRDPMFGMNVARLLLQDGMHTKLVAAPLEALEVITTSSWDVLLLELCSPVQDAVALASGAAQMRRGPALLITSVDPELLALRKMHELAAVVVPKAQLGRAPMAWIAAALQARHSLRNEHGVALRTPPPLFRTPAGAPHRPLSKREREVFSLLKGGCAPKEIACELGLSHATVRTHARNAYRKLGVTNLREALAHS
jgi:DNA-binding NarL/FixJ family response regulator